MIADEYRRQIALTPAADPGRGATGAEWASIVEQAADKFGAADTPDGACGKQSLARAS